MEKQTISIESVKSFVHNTIFGKPVTYRSTGEAEEWLAPWYAYEFEEEGGNKWVLTQHDFDRLLEQGTIRDAETSEWLTLLHQANKALEDKGCRIVITEPEEGFFKCDIIRPSTKTYAENYYENELEDLITDAWNYANTL